MSLPHRLVSLPLLSCLIASTTLTGAVAQPASSSDSILSPANIIGGVLRSLIGYGRLVADIRYNVLQVDTARSGIVLRDLTIAGLGDYKDCRISVGSLRVSGVSFWGAEQMNPRLDASDVSVATNCFGPNAAMIGMVTGGPQIVLSDLSVESSQSVGSGRTLLDIDLVSPGLARLEASGSFDYLSLSAPDLLTQATTFQPDAPGDPFDPDAASQPNVGLRGTLRSAHLSVEDLGAWDRARQLLPPDATRPEVADGLVTAAPGTALHDFQQQGAEALKAFMQQPGRVTVQILPADPVAFDSTEWQTPEDAVALFNPVVLNGAPTPPLALLADAGAAGDARAAGLALARGAGVPQNTAEAIKLLTPLQDDPEIALVLADLLAATDPAAAYAHAARAAAAGATGAPGVLDRIEARLDNAALLAAQPAADTDAAEGAFASVIALRDAARGYEDGKGVPRSYAMAWRLASLAAAAGDGPAQSLMARVDARFGSDPAWLAVRDAAADQAARDWDGQKLAGRLAGG